MENLSLEDKDDTLDKLRYIFYQIPNGCVQFKVRAMHDAHLALTTQPEESDEVVEVIIGAWVNNKSIIRKNKQQQVIVNTVNILSANDFRGFWIKINGSIIEVGKEDCSLPFLTWSDPKPIQINYVGVSSAWGACASWIINDPTDRAFPPDNWIPATNGCVPPDAVCGGGTPLGERFYIARANHDGALLPGYLHPSYGLCFVSWKNHQFTYGEYEVLCEYIGKWVPASGKQYPPGLLEAGETDGSESLFIGRVHHNGAVIPGRVQPSKGVCFVAYEGKELAFSDYEVFVS